MISIRSAFETGPAAGLAGGASTPARNATDTAWKAELERQIAAASVQGEGQAADASSGGLDIPTLGNGSAGRAAASASSTGAATGSDGGDSGSVLYGIVQGTWNAADENGVTTGGLWPGYSTNDPSGTSWQDYGFDNPHAPVTDPGSGYSRLPGQDPNSAPPGSLGAFDPATGLYDWIRSGSGITMNTPGPGNIGPAGSGGEIDGQSVVTDARGRTTDQSEALLALEAHDPNMARTVQNLVEYWNPDFHYSPGMSDQDIVAGLTNRYTGGKTAVPGTMYLPYGGRSMNADDYSAWHPVASSSNGSSSVLATEPNTDLASLTPSLKA